MIMSTILDELTAVARRLRDREALVITRDRLILATREEGMSWKEIAAALDVEPQVAQNMGQRALKRFGRK